jgi:hypothetical protein
MDFTTPLFFVFAGFAVGVLVWRLRVAYSRDTFTELIRRRRSTELIDGWDHVPLAITAARESRMNSKL